jgi:CRISPR-associated RAMP protein (TIGR02581 family)
MPEPRMPSHATFDSVVLFEVVLRCRTGLHIGGGKSAALVGSDLPVIRDADGRPLIPGSSLRGVLRSGVEGLCGSLDLNARRPQLAVEAAGSPAGKLSAQWNGISLVERLFGRIGGKRGELTYASRVQFSDARCSDEVAVELRDGVAISRETRTAAAETGGKFDLEVVPAGTEFHGSVRVRNGAEFEVGLIAQALWMLDQGLLLLGGNSARGLGWMEVQVSPPRVFTAADILAGASAASSGDSEPGPVHERLAPFLDALCEFAADGGPAVTN